MNRKKDILGFSKIALAAIFLFNPTVHIVDPLPDFIGYWLIAFGLTNLAYLSETLWQARKSFVYLTFLGVAKTLVSLTLPDARSTFTVLMAFVFAVGEAILFLPAASALFEGVCSLGLRHAGDSPFFVPVTKGKLRKAEKTDNKLADCTDETKKARLLKKRDRLLSRMTVGTLKIFTNVAFLVRAAGAVVPVLPNLMLYGDVLFVTEGRINWGNYSWLFYIIFWIAGFWTGIPWMSSFRRYFKGIASEESFVGVIVKKLERDVLSDKMRLEADRMKRVMILSVLACGLTFCFPVDYINFVPNLLSAAAVIAALVYMYPLSKKLCIAGMAAGSVWAVLSGIGLYLMDDFTARNYDPKAAVAFEGTGRGMADELYFRIEIFSYAEALFFLVTALIFCKVFMKVLDTHIGMMPPRRDGVARDTEKMKKCLKPVAISGGVVIAFNFALTFVTKYFTGAWLINGIAVAVLFVFALRAYYKLSDDVYLPLKRKF